MTALLVDAIRIVHYNIVIIDTAPLQLYSSVLIFAPQNSIIRGIFQKDIPRWITIRPRTDEDWDPCSYLIEDLGEATEIAFSHDDSLILSDLDNGTLRLSHTDTGSCVRYLEGHAAPVHSVTFSHDSSLMASISSDRNIRIWRTETGECMHRLEFQTGGEDFNTCVEDTLDIEKGKRHRRDSNSYESRDGLFVEDFLFSHDSSFIASAYGTNWGPGWKWIEFWRTDTGERIRTLKISGCDDYSAAFSCEGNLLVVSILALADDKVFRARIWRLNEHECVRVHDFHTPLVRVIYWDPKVKMSLDASSVALALCDGTVWLWKTDTGVCTRKFELGNFDWVASMIISPDSSLVATYLSSYIDASEEMTSLQLWRADTGASVPLEIEEGIVTCASMIFSHDSQFLAASISNSVRVWRTNTGECIHVLRNVEGGRLAFSHVKSLLASISNKRVRLWRYDTQALAISKEKEGVDFHNYITSMTLSYDSSMVASLDSNDEKLRLWSTETGRQAGVAKLSVSRSNTCAFSNDNSIFAACYGKGNLGLWKVPDLTLIRVLEVHKDAVSSIAFAQDDSLLASGGRPLRIWRTDTWDLLKEFWGRQTDYDDSSCWSLAFSSDSRFLLESRLGPRRGCMVIFRNVNTGQLVWKLEDGTKSAPSIAFSRDESLVALTFHRDEVVLCRAGDGARIGTIALGGEQLFLPFSKNGFVEGANLFLTQERLDFTQFGGYGISKDNWWITWNGANLLWLPPDYRPRETASHGLTVALGCSSGRLAVLGFQNYPGPLQRLS